MLFEELGNLRSQLAACQQENEHFNVSIQELNMEIGTKSQRLMQVERELAHSKERLHHTSSDLATKTAKLVRSESDLQRASSVIREISDAEHADLVGRLRDINRENEMLRRALREVKHRGSMSIDERFEASGEQVAEASLRICFHHLPGIHIS